MKSIVVHLDDGTGCKFNRVKEHSLQNDGQIRFYTKEQGTIEGNPIIMISFKVMQDNGQIKNVQSVTTLNLFMAAVDILKQKYSDNINNDNQN